MKTIIDMDHPDCTMRTLPVVVLSRAEREGWTPTEARALRLTLLQAQTGEQLCDAIDAAMPGCFEFYPDPRGAGPNCYENCTQYEAEHGLG